MIFFLRNWSKSKLTTLPRNRAIFFAKFVVHTTQYVIFPPEYNVKCCFPSLIVLFLIFSGTIPYLRETDSRSCPEKALSWQTERALTPEEESDTLLDPSRRKEKEAIIKKERKEKKKTSDPRRTSPSFPSISHRKKEEGAHFSGEWFSLLFLLLGKKEREKEFFCEAVCSTFVFFTLCIRTRRQKKEEKGEDSSRSPAYTSDGKKKGKRGFLKGKQAPHPVFSRARVRTKKIKKVQRAKQQQCVHFDLFLFIRRTEAINFQQQSGRGRGVEY